MAHVYLLDVSYLAPFEACLPRNASEPPISWRCAAELAQWTSVAAVENAWIAACAETRVATTVTERASDRKRVTADAATRTSGREGYVRLGEDDDHDQAKAFETSVPIAKEVSPPSHHPYLIHTFPSAVHIENKYFSTTLTLLTGAPLRHPSCQGQDRASPSAQCDITADLLQKCAGSTTRSSTAVSPVDDSGRYGGVLLAQIMQDPAGVPWHAFLRGGCLFKVIMVFQNSETDTAVGNVGAAAPESLVALKSRGSRQQAGVRCHPPQDATLPADDTLDHASASLRQLKERWKYLAAENGYECVFHTAVCPPRTAAHAAASMESSGRDRDGCAGDVQLECVNVDSGRRGLLEGPLSGSNRLYQILCNTLWPADVRRAAAATSGAPNDGHIEQENSTIPQAPKLLKPNSGNAFVVVSDDEDAMWRLFQQQGDVCAHMPGRRFPFLTVAISLPADSAAASEAPGAAEGKHIAVTARRTRLVLVNRYYAAVVQPRLVQTAFFDTRMQELLGRYWEQHIATESGSDDLCPDAPAVVLWPPGSSTSCASCAENETQGAVSICADTNGEDVRALYPSLEVVLDSLARFGCREVVVVVNERGGGAVPSGFTEYEALLCRARNVEVVQPDPARLKTAKVGTIERDVDDLPVPVLRDEDDTRAARGSDRLQELLHCVQWTQTHLMKCAASPTACPANRSSNSCLLLAFGRTPFEEEAWVRDVLADLSVAHSSTHSKSAAVCTEEYLRLAAPTVAAALRAGHSDGSADFGAHSSGASVEVDVSTPYFNVRVDVYIQGGLYTYYAAQRAQRSGTRTMPPGWEDAHDAYVVVTSLRALQEEHAINVSSVHTTVVDTSNTEVFSRSQGTLGIVISTLARRQKETWLAEQIDAYVSHQNSQETFDAAADSPLVLLYITDVLPADATRVKLVEQLVLALARSTVAPAATSLGEKGSDGVHDTVDYVPIELVFASESVGVPTGATTTGRYHDLVVDGTARVREAFEQHLWPHRQSLSHHYSRVSNICPTTHTREEVASPRDSVEVGSATIANSFSNEVTRASPPPVDTAATAATAPTETVTLDTSWVAPVIGCALPSGYLIDPETLRSVPVRILQDAPSNTAKIEGRQSCGKASTEHAQPMAQPRNDAELMQWMEKMKRYGHRLGESLRKEQAEVLALSLEKTL
ncbi:hypothetical protein, conserved [Leishmania tarentolae]|uniref:Uncharacterized protein n=1 Tax=Leishmania tarentolae TaxID=5689 RepID=A0A640KGW6_LEITA|nr:hypothetical protein, conserved [Leishmania tarentolae]